MKGTLELTQINPQTDRHTSSSVQSQAVVNESVENNTLSQSSTGHLEVSALTSHHESLNLS